MHKASHHFDLVNWWIDALPEVVFGLGRRFFYGPEPGAAHGMARSYRRVHGAPDAAGDPFALRLADNPALKALYLDAEHEDGYHRDQNVFGPGVTIEDDMAVAVRYTSGATLTYHLTAYAPWEGYRLMVNGSLGRLELEVVESSHVDPEHAGALKSAALHGAEAPAEEGWARLELRPLWEPPVEIPLPLERAGHGGADRRMLAVLLGGEPDPMERMATQRDGALSLLTGLAANRSFETGGPARVADLRRVP